MKRIKVGFIGGGNNSNIGKSHLRAINSTGKWIIVSGLFSRKRINNFIEFDKNIRKYTNLNHFIIKEKNKIDAIVLLTPPSENFQILKKILKIGKPIISEKPVLDSISKALVINNLIKKKKIFFKSTYNYSGYPALKEIKKIIKSKINQIVKINIEMPQQGLFLSRSNIKPWRMKDGNLPTLFLDLGSHIFNLCFYLLGKYPIKINCIHKSNKKRNLVDDSNFWCKYPNNIMGNFWISKFAGGNNNNLKINIIGKTFSIFWEHQKPDVIKYSENTGEVKIINRANTKLKYMNNKKYNSYMAGHPTGYLETFINFYNDTYNDIIKSKFKANRENTFGFDHCLKIIKILTSAKLSAQRKNWVKIK